MKSVLDENSLDWALIHLTRFCDNDFLPPIFEFELIARNWQEVRSKILNTDLETCMPRPTQVRHVPKQYPSFRVVHRLDPVDSLIYTAMVYEIHGALKKSRGTDPGSSIRSLRVEPAADGSFFSSGSHSWKSHTGRIESLSNKHQSRGSEHPGGYVLIADIQDFFGRIQPLWLVQKLIDARALPPARAQAFGRALSAIGAVTSAGIPTGSAASTVLSEMVLGDIDRKVLQHSADYTRWSDDMQVFFRTRAKAEEARDDLARFLYSVYGMAFTPEKTRVMSVDEFRTGSLWGVPAETVDAGAAEEQLNHVLHQGVHPLKYGWMIAPLPTALQAGVGARIQEMPEFQKVGNTYGTHFARAVESGPPDLRTARRILRKAAQYRIPAILPAVLAHFDVLTPVIREAATYLKAVLDVRLVKTHAQELRKAWEKRPHSTAYVNDWWCHVLTSPCFNEIDLPKNYGSIPEIRNQALIALRRNDVAWVKRNVVHLAALDLWDRRGVLFACTALPHPEGAAVAGSVRRGITEMSVARYVAPGGPSAAAPDEVKGRMRVADRYSFQDMYTTGLDTGNYPTTGYSGGTYDSSFPWNSGGDGPMYTGDYGNPPFTGYTSSVNARDLQSPGHSPVHFTKVIQPSPRWLMERIPELDAILRNSGDKIMVSFQDSIDSGNCMSGTETYRGQLLARLRLPAETHAISARALLADCDDPLTRRAARAAAMRYASRNRRTP